MREEDNTAIKSALISQYRASLMMFRNAINLCSPELWLSGRYPNPTWQMVYHALFFMDLYLYPHLDDCKSWEGHRKGYQDFERKDLDPYTKPEVLQFLSYIDNRLESAVNGIDLNAPECGFYWYKVNKLEHQLVNLKHLQHHLGQLQDRIRNEQGEGIGWIRDGSGDVRKD
ncbi:MAG: DinB family protein [Saprospiraceae bacterium]|nr:DinB family protein [Saprospiraceae bacterium]